VKCIILAAGASTRIRPLADAKPKCLLPVGGKPILQRIIENIVNAGCDSIGIVLGYRAKDVRAFVKVHFPFHRVRFLMNPKFESTNNAFSLLMAREFYLGERRRGAPEHELLLLDSDIVFSPGLLPYFLGQKSPNRVAVRVKGGHDDEEIRVKIDREREIVMIGKTTPLSETYGESIGIELFSPPAASLLFETLEARVHTGSGRTEFYEASFQELIDRGVKVAAVDISDFAAVEIDTPEDLDYAERVVVPLLGS
jgi:choline kinase